MTFRLTRLIAALLMLGGPVGAQCTGANLIDALSAADRAALDDSLRDQPFATGNFWRATRDGAAGPEVVHLIGTYHLADPRHAATMETLRPLIAAATTVLVEAGPQEEAALETAVASDPSLLFVQDGPTLPERLTEAEWDQLSAAMWARDIPPFMAAKFRPWYVSVVLGMPPCAMAAALSRDGLDQRVIDAATVAGVPVQALEPWDTVFGLFGSLTPAEELGMIRSTLPMEKMGADYAVTLADAYFAEDTRMIWEFMRLTAHDMPAYTPEAADAEFSRMEDVLMIQRNRAWIPVIAKAAARGPVVVAFGALHLSGQEGVLALLEDEGFTLERASLIP